MIGGFCALTLLSMGGCNFINNLLGKGNSAAPQAQSSQCPPSGITMHLLAQAPKLAESPAAVPEGCEVASVTMAAENIFSKDVQNGDETVSMPSELGSLDVRRLTYNTSSQALSNPTAYELSYHSDIFQVDAVLANGQMVAGRGASLDAAINNASTKCQAN